MQPIEIYFKATEILPLTKTYSKVWTYNDSDLDTSYPLRKGPPDLATWADTFGLVDFEVEAPGRLDLFTYLCHT